MERWMLELLVVGGVGFAAGALLAWLVVRARAAHALQAAQGAAESERAGLQERVSGLDARAAEALATLQNAQREVERLREQLGEARGELARVEERARRVPVLEQDRLALEARSRDLTEEIGRLRTELGQLQTRRENELRAAEEKLALLGEARVALTEQFKNLASEILEDKSRRFTELNQANLGQLLDPLRTRLTEFQARVEQVYDAEGKERVVLADQVRRLFELNQQISKEANDLTRALKGSSKTQGYWGERVLESLLELAGLQRDLQYVVQESHQREDGSRAQPDVVIHMPEDRRLVVDAKVSLTAFEEYASAEDEAARESALRRHVESVRAHVKGLHERDYQQLHGIGSYDFVLMFVAVEPAFMLAVTQDRELFQYAWSRNVLLVSPSTLLFVLRTVAQLWRQDAQNRNALEISKRGAELYDKLVLFVESLEGVGQRLKLAQDEFDKAHVRLIGRGGAIRQAEMLRKLGVRPKKSLPSAVAALVSEATEEEPAAGEGEGTGEDPGETALEGGKTSEGAAGEGN